MQQELTVRRGGSSRFITQTQQARAELDMLTAQRGELQSQLSQLAERRNQLFAQSQTVPDIAARRDIESRMREIDARSAKLDGQIAALNDRIVEAMARTGPGGPVPIEVPRVIQVPQVVTVPGVDRSLFSQRSRGPDMREVAGFMAAEAVALVLLGVVAWRFGMKRMREQFSLMLTAQHTQMNQLQQSVDVIGVEVERISEAQRYVAKKLTEGSPVAASVGREGVMAKRDG